MNFKHTAYSPWAEIDIDVVTTGHMGGNQSHGGSTLVTMKITDGDLDFSLTTDDRCLSVQCVGDSELNVIMEAFDFVARSLKEALGRNPNEPISPWYQEEQDIPPS